MAATLTQTMDLIILAGLAIMTVVGYIAFRRKNYLWHGQLMTVGVVVTVVTFLLVMLPSLLMTYTTFLDPATAFFDAVSLIHIPLGILGLGLGAYLVFRWARNGYKLANMKATGLMRATAVTWIANIVVGAMIFFSMPS
jgi:uncharacterized membrane protein YozB (DUF420 family)